MTTTRPRGRYRAQVRPKTPLTQLSDAVSLNAGTMSRRSAVIAASSGLVVTMGLPAAGATPVTDAAPEQPQERTASVDAVKPEPKPEVTVPADAQVSFAGATVTDVTEPPPPPPPPAPEVRETEERTTTTSRSTQRESVSSQASETVESASASGGSILTIAARYVGTPYRYGGTTPDGFDCSGYTQYVYKQAGISIPRTSGAQGSGGRRVSASQAQPGDLVWNGNGHIGIYAGGNQMYDSPRTGKTVQKRDIWFSPIFVSYR